MFLFSCRSHHITAVVVVTLALCSACLVLAFVKVTACRFSLVHSFLLCSTSPVGGGEVVVVGGGVYTNVKEQGACIRGGKKGYCPASMPSAGNRGSRLTASRWNVERPKQEP